MVTSSTAFEIKFLAQREVMFELNRASFMSPTAGWLGVYSPIDYLLFRLYEAARKLQETHANRIAVAIVSDHDVSFLYQEAGLIGKILDFSSVTQSFKNFFQINTQKNQDLDAELKTSIRALDEIWILRYKGAFKLHLEHRIQIS